MALTEGKIVFITGAARGLGRACAIRFAKEGADVALFDICRDVPGIYASAMRSELEDTANEIRSLGKRSLALVGNVRSGSDLKAAAEETVKEFGKIDVVVPMVGVATVANAWELTEEEWDIVIGTNLTGAWLTAKHTIPFMIEKKQGRLIFIGSGAALGGRPQMAHYCASKWGVIGMMKSLAIDLAPYRITVNAVCPATVQTGSNTKMAEEMGISFEELVGRWTKLQLIQEMIQPEDIAGAVAWMASDEARYITAHALAVTAGASLT